MKVALNTINQTKPIFLCLLNVLFTERMRRNFESLDSDRQVLMKELDRLRKQYDDLIKQLEQTQVIVDQQKVNITQLF